MLIGVRNKAVICLLEQSQRQTIALERRPFRQFSNRSDVSWWLKIRGSEVHFLPTIEVCSPNVAGLWCRIFQSFACLEAFCVLLLGCFDHSDYTVERWRFVLSDFAILASLFQTEV